LVKIEDYLSSELKEHTEVLNRTAQTVGGVFAGLALACAKSIAAGGKLVFFGNGGSAADAQHLATELVVRYRANRKPISAIALTTDTSALTAIGNDFGFDDVFARQVEALCRRGDVAIGLSTSGNSENVIRGLQVARAQGAITAGFVGGTGGRMLEVVDLAIIIPSTTTARIQEMHLLLGHILCALLESEAPV
jgi:D-sedoheptulose 7-phosphate isomerase